MKIIFLGTGSMQPTRERNLSSIYLNYENEHMLFDCGEGTQRQIKLAELKTTSITRVFISHFHADHILGLGGLLRNLQANQYNKTLYVYGPKDIKNFFSNIAHSAYFGNGLNVKVIEFKEGKIVDADKFTIEAVKLKHSVDSYGFIFKEKDKRKIDIKYTAKFGLTQHPLLGELQRGKDIVWEGKKISVKKATKLVEGKKIGIIWDTGLCSGCNKVAKNADLLICESTYSDKDKDKAKEYLHLTARQAGEIAKRGKAKRLILHHFSQRYKNIKELENEAKTIFKNSECADDFKIVNV